MSTPTVKPTRQQLEELDDLLQRMLAMPGQPDGQAPTAPPAAAPAAPRTVAAPGGDHAWNVSLPPGTGASFNGWPVGIEALAQNARPAAAPPQPPAGRLNVTMVPPPAPVMPQAHIPPMPPVPPPTAPTVAMHRPVPVPIPVPLPTLPEPPLPFYLWPLGALDRSMGGILAAFGPPGRWLGQGSGKILIGWAGLLMIGGAAVWGVMDYMGWSW